MFYENNNSLENEDFDFVHVSGMEWPEHFHRNFELFAVTSGEAAARVDNKDYALSAGDAVLVFPYQIHSYPPPKRNLMEGCLLIFSPSFVSYYAQKHGGKKPVSNKFKLHLDVNTDFDGDMLMKLSYLYKLLADFSEQTELIKCGADGGLTERIIEYANNNFRGSCTLTGLAEHLNYSYSYISKYFKENSGLDFKRYVNTLRANYAYEKLQSGTRQNIASIAFESGFSSLRTFNREFKSNFGCTPTEFRKQRGIE